MLAIPFELETVPISSAAEFCRTVAEQHSGTTPVLLGDADVFSAEWAETVDAFEDPEAILAEAEKLDVDAWFAARKPRIETARQTSQSLSFVKRIFGAGPPATANLEPSDRLRRQLEQLEAGGDNTADELREMREVVEAIEEEGADMPVFPDPVDYITPWKNDSLAAGMIATDASWKSAAWLQHGTYALSVPKPVLVAHCRWLWETYEARILTASTDHLGFEVNRPPQTLTEAQDVLARFFAICADEVNAEYRGTDASSLIGQKRWWVWWD